MQQGAAVLEPRRLNFSSLLLTACAGDRGCVMIATDESRHIQT